MSLLSEDIFSPVLDLKILIKTEVFKKYNLSMTTKFCPIDNLQYESAYDIIFDEIFSFEEDKMKISDIGTGALIKKHSILRTIDNAASIAYLKSMVLKEMCEYIFNEDRPGFSVNYMDYIDSSTLRKYKHNHNIEYVNKVFVFDDVPLELSSLSLPQVNEFWMYQHLDKLETPKEQHTLKKAFQCFNAKHINKVTLCFSNIVAPFNDEGYLKYVEFDRANGLQDLNISELEITITSFGAEDEIRNGAAILKTYFSKLLPGVEIKYEYKSIYEIIER